MLELENAGNAAATVPIRVDLYFDPDHVPGEGDPWDALATYGAHWTVPTARLPGAGEALTLRLADAEGARYPPSFVGLAHAYVRVDTLSVVPELDEGNNLMQIDLPDLDGPDLVVAEFVATEDGVQIVLENVGEGVVSDPFWVDLYVDPHPAPTRVNQIWEDLAEAGAVWGVTEGALPLRTGDALTLTVDGPYFRAEYGHLDLPLAVGTPVYVQVDSANAGTLYGGVLEYHELVGGAYNNIASTTVVAGRGLSPMRERGSPGGGLPDVLPARP
jgi:hypothetical protein